MRNTTTTVVIAAGLVLAAVIVSRTPGQEQVAAGPSPPLPTGACCLPGVNACIDAISADECLFAFGGVYQGDGTTCGGASCGACCLPDESCVDLTSPNACAALGGSHEADTECFQVDCTIAHCPHDIDDDGMVGIVDFLDLLAAWGACP